MTCRRVLIAAGLMVGAICPQAWAQARKQAPKPADVAFSLAGAKTLFKRVDKDGDGLVSAAEAPGAGLGPRDVASADTDKNGKLGESEFLLSLHGVLSSGGKTIAPDFQSEVDKLRAAAKAAPKPAAPAGAPQPARATPAPASNAPAATAKPATAKPAQPAAPASNPVEALDSKIEEALRKAEAGESGADARAERPRQARGSSSSGEGAGTELAGLSEEAKAALNRRLRNTGVTPEAAAAERQALEQRIANAQGAQSGGAGTPQPAPAAPAAKPAAPPARPAATPPPAQAPKLAGASAVKPVAEVGAGAPVPAASNTPPKAAPAAPEADPAAAAMARLEQRLKSTNATPEQAEKARAELRERIDRAAKRGDGEGATPGAPERDAKPAEDEGESKLSSEERARLAREKLEARLKSTNATPEQAKAARENLERRLKLQAEGGEPEADDEAAKGGARPGGAAPAAKPSGAKPGAAAGQTKPAGPAKRGAGAAPAGGAPQRPGAGQGGGQGGGGNRGAAPAGGRGAAPANGGARPAGGSPQKP